MVGMKKIELGLNHWTQDTSAKSLSWFPSSFPVVVTKQLIDNLESKSRESKLNTRVCLHELPESNLHEMIICQRYDQAHPPKLHFDKDKTFYILRGKLLVITFDDSGNVLDSWLLENSPFDTPIGVRVPAGVFHCEIALGLTAVHIENTLGPFSPLSDREYLWPKMGKSEWEEIKKQLVQNLTIN